MSALRNPSRSYIAGSDDYTYFVGDRAIPRDVGDAVLLMGPGVWDRMLKDPAVQGVVDGLFIAVLAQPLTVGPAFEIDAAHATAEQKADAKLAAETADYLRLSLDALAMRKGYGLYELLWDFLRATMYGHRLGEIVTDTILDGPFVRNEVAASLTVKPRGNYNFVLDQTNTFKGVVAKVPGVSMSLREGLLYDFRRLPNAIDPDKIALLTLGGKEGDPRGQSWLEACYSPWYDRQIIRVERLKAIAQHAGGKISGTTGPNATGGVSADGIAQTAEEAMADKLAEFANGGVFVGEQDSTVTVHFGSGAVDGFDAALMTNTREIALAFVKTARAQMEAERSSQADSGDAQDVRHEVIVYLRNRLCETMREAFRPMVRRNRGPIAAGRLMPVFSMASVGRPDLGQTVAALAKAGFRVFASQIPALCRLLGIPEPTEEELASLTLAAQTPGDQEEDPEEKESTAT